MKYALGRQGNLVVNTLVSSPGGPLLAYCFWFKCPGCASSGGSEAHRYEVREDGGQPSWEFNGDFKSPTFTPSLLQQYSDPRGHHVCHLFITAGKIYYCSDCTHALAGQVVELPEPPRWLF